MTSPSPLAPPHAVPPARAPRGRVGKGGRLALAAVLAAGFVLATVAFFLVPRGTSKGDVQVRSCTQDVSANLTTLTASLVVTNTKSAPADYRITVAFTTDHGRAQLGTATASVYALAPGQSAMPKATTFGGPAPGGDLTCEVVAVTRS